MARIPRIGLRSVAVVVAVALAALATVALLSYVQGIESRAEAELDMVEAFVAKERIPSGTPAEAAISGGLIAREGVPKKLVATGAIRSLQEIQGRVAQVDILAGEQILGARFVEPQEARGMLPIPDGRQAISFEVGIPPGVAGFIQAGDKISVIAQLNVAGSGGEETTRVAYLLQDVPVLAVGRRVVTAESEGQGGNQVRREEGRVLLTVALPPVEAEKLAYALFQGQLHLTLLPPDLPPEEAVVDTPGRTRENGFQ